MAAKKSVYRTDTVFLPISEVCDGDGTVSLTIYYVCAQSCGGNLALIIYLPFGLFDFS